MPKYWGKQIFTHGSFPEVGENKETEEKSRCTQDRVDQFKIICTSLVFELLNINKLRFVG